MTTESCADRLKSAGLNASYQRCRVYEFLLKNKTHPTADEIFSSLRPEMPTLSKMTVYNVLGALCDKGLIRDIRISSGETRYDSTTHDHGHFRCHTCGCIYDFEMPPEAFRADMLEGFDIWQADLIYRGLCPGCAD